MTSVRCRRQPVVKAFLSAVLNLKFKIKNSKFHPAPAGWSLPFQNPAHQREGRILGQGGDRLVLRLADRPDILGGVIIIGVDLVRILQEGLFFPLVDGGQVVDDRNAVLEDIIGGGGVKERVDVELLELDPGCNPGPAWSWKSPAGTTEKLSRIILGSGGPGITYG